MLLMGDEDEGLKMEPAACEPVRVFSQPRGPDGLVVKFSAIQRRQRFPRDQAISLPGVRRIFEDRAGDRGAPEGVGISHGLDAVNHADELVV